MQVKAKLKVSGITENNWGPGSSKSGESIDMYAVYSPDKESENYSYSQATPFAHLNISVTNPDAWGFFEGGAEYVITFEKV